MEFFCAERVSPHITQIINVPQAYCYLVEGEEKAALIDAGDGLGNLGDFVRTLTDKPVFVILTHGHVDHIGGAVFFDEVYLNEKDWALARKHDTPELKHEYAGEFLPPETFRSLSEGDFSPTRTGGYLPLEDGQVFDLGGITLEALALPGHTQGMTCILAREERSVFFGDGCSPSVYLWLEDSSTVEEYRESLLRFKTQEDRYDTVYLSHGPRTVAKRVLDDVLELCDGLMHGVSDAQPIAMLGEEPRIAKRTDRHFRRLDGGVGNIVYDPERIWKNGGAGEQEPVSHTAP